MNNPSASLLQVIKRLKGYGAGVFLGNTDIQVEILPEKCLLDKTLPLLYLLLNKFEKSYFIVIKSLPFCLMPDADHHILYPKKGKYLKTKTCQACKYKKECPGWPKDLKQKGAIRPHPVDDLPREIVIEITSKCNLDCLLCFKDKNISEVPLATIKRIIDSCARLKIDTIRFTGGEPLLHSHIKTALQYAKSKDLYVIVNTNATVLDREMKIVLRGCVDNVLIPLQGYNPASERALTGAAECAFKEKLQNILELSTIIPTVRLGTIISSTLIRNFKRYYYLIKRLSINNWEMFRPMAGMPSKEFAVSRQDLLKVMRHIAQIKRDIGEVKIANAVPFCITADFTLSRYVLLGAGADDGHARIVFDSRGFFKPSYPINENLGNDIMAAWQSPFLKKIRSLSYLPAQCKRCYYVKWCKGGSRYLAKAKMGSYFEKDPLMPNG